MVFLVSLIHAWSVEPAGPAGRTVAGKRLDDCVKNTCVPAARRHFLPAGKPETFPDCVKTCVLNLPSPAQGQQNETNEHPEKPCISVTIRLPYPSGTCRQSATVTQSHGGRHHQTCRAFPLALAGRFFLIGKLEIHAPSECVKTCVLNLQGKTMLKQRQTSENKESCKKHCISGTIWLPYPD